LRQDGRGFVIRLVYELMMILLLLLLEVVVVVLVKVGVVNVVGVLLIL